MVKKLEILEAKIANYNFPDILGLLAIGKMGNRYQFSIKQRFKNEKFAHKKSGGRQCSRAEKSKKQHRSAIPSLSTILASRYFTTFPDEPNLTA